MVQVRGQQVNRSEVKSMDGNRDTVMQQSRSSGNLKSQCAASSINRQNILSNDYIRKESLAQLKQLLRDVNNAEVSGRLNAIILEIYMDAEYRERSNIQLREMVVNYEHHIMKLEKYQSNL